jgi:hypothetical protein
VSKSRTRTLYLLGLLGLVVGLVLYVVAANQGALDANGTPMLTGPGATLALVALAVYVVASILATVAWVGALIKMAQLQRWGWFVGLLLFSGIALLIYVFAGPTTAKGQVPAGLRY